MAFIVKPTRDAWDEYQRLDVGLREEVRRHIAEAADDPMAHLRRAPTPRGVDSFLLSYDSELVEGLRVTLTFSDFDQHAGSMLLTGISHVMHPPVDDP